MEPVIQVSELVKRYRKAERNAVDGVSFAVEPGSFFALLGPNGAGKTTTISVLTTTLRPTSGQLRVAGHDLLREPDAVRRQLGIIFQKPSLDLNLTAEENVRLHAVLYGLYPMRPAYRLMPAGYRAQVQHLAEVLGIAGEMSQPVRTFSGGMRRKLEIVRSLIHEPRVLFLDEPTTGLDPASRRDLWAYLKAVRQRGGTTVFLTTHYIEEAEAADRICVIHRGRVVSLGSTDEVKADLVEDYVSIDAEDGAALAAELEGLGARFAPDPELGGFRVAVKGAGIHPLLAAVRTPLTRVRTHTPTLEEAYLEILERS
ncbi:MAG: ABC transporter ATP-binding protein [Caldilineae bacterium]|nr:ABC transporter ATP-binding protein [Chloroflexota bacterium]MCB9177026.1 ABC transporter ATP-binding protein [Caldilineae bacterium]